MLMARGKTHDRTTKDVPFNSITATVEVDDPSTLVPEPGKLKDRLRVTVSLRDDPLGRMWARRQIPSSDYHAARHWQRLYESVEIGGLRGMQLQDPVDGGRFPELVTDKYSRAFNELKRLTKVLGLEGDAIVRDFLGNRMMIKDHQSGLSVQHPDRVFKDTVT